MGSNRAAMMVVAWAGVAVACTPALAGFTFKKVPDFYQHQKAHQNANNGMMGIPLPPDAKPSPLKPSYNGKNWWESTGGWCSTTAWVNALAYADKELGAKGLFDHSRGHESGHPQHAGKSWQERFAYANEDLAITAGNAFGIADGACAWPEHVRSYADRWGVGATVDEFKWMGGKVHQLNLGTGMYEDKSGTYASMFDVASTHFADGVMVMIIRGSPANVWWSGSFHALTIAGVDAAAKKLAAADPNDTFRGADWGKGYINTDAYPTDSDYYAQFSFADGLTLGDHKVKYNGGMWEAGLYNGTTMGEIFLLKVPTPGTLAMLVAGGMIAGRRRR